MVISDSGITDQTTYVRYIRKRKDLLIRNMEVLGFCALPKISQCIKLAFLFSSSYYRYLRPGCVTAQESSTITQGLFWSGHSPPDNDPPLSYKGLHWKSLRSSFVADMMCSQYIPSFQGSQKTWENAYLGVLFSSVYRHLSRPFVHGSA